MPYTVRIYTAIDQSAWNDYQYGTMVEAFHSIKGYSYVPGEIVDMNLADPTLPGMDWLMGFKIYDELGVCFHSHDGLEHGETLT